MSKHTLIIDADVFRYQLAYANTKAYNFDGDIVELTNPDAAKEQLLDTVYSFMDELEADSFVLPLSVKTNFRKNIFPAYKIDRAKKPKPALWYDVDRHLKELWPDKIITRSRLEGDDIIGILATHPDSKYIQGEPVIVSIDKDMQTIPAKLYNPNKPGLGIREITEDEADHYWMFQTLTGDSTDGYPGLPGVGPKRAEAVLHNKWTLPDMWGAVVAAYEQREYTKDDAIVQARLARILRYGDYDFTTGEIRLWSPDSILEAA